MLPSLADVQGKDYPSPHILVCDQLGGNEDIPVSSPPPPCPPSSSPPTPRGRGRTHALLMLPCPRQMLPRCARQSDRQRQEQVGSVQRYLGRRGASG